MVDGNVSLSATFKVAFTGQQDLTTYTKGGSDPDPFTSVTSTTATQLNLLNSEDNFLFKDYGPDAFGDFIHLFRFRLTGLVTSGGGAYERYHFWAVTNYVNDYSSQSPDNNENVLALVLEADGAGEAQYQLRIRGDGETQHIPFGGNVAGGTTYYAKITKLGAEIKAQIYTDAARTALKDSGTITLQADRKYRYAYATQGLDYSQTGYGSQGSTSYFEFYDLTAPTPRELKAGFYVKQWQEDLKAEFEVGQGVEELLAELSVQQAGSVELVAGFRSGYVVLLIPTTSKTDYDSTDKKVTLALTTSEDSVIPEQRLLTFSGVEFGAPSMSLKAWFYVNAGVQNLKAGFYIPIPFEELKARFEVGQLTSDLPAELIVQQTGSIELTSGFTVRQGSVDLKAVFTVIGSLNLYAKFSVQTQEAVDLKAVFKVGQDIRNLYARFLLPTSASVDYKATFNLIRNVTLDLPAAFVVAQGKEDLLAEFVVPQFFVSLLAGFNTMWSPIPLNIPASFIVTQGTENLLAEFTVTNQSADNLTAKFRVSVNTTAVPLKAVFMIATGNFIFDMPAQFYVKQWYADLKAGFFRGILDSEDLAAGFMIKQNEGTDLSAAFDVAQGNKDLQAKFIVRQGIVDLKSGFYVKAGVADFLSKMHVNYGEDYQLYTESDPTGVITLTPGNESNEVVTSGVLAAGNMGGKLYKTTTPYVFGFNSGDYLKIEVEGYIESTVVGGDGNWIMAVLFAISDSPDDIYTQWTTAGYNFIALTGGQYGSGDYDFWLITRSDDTGVDDNYLDPVNLATKYYITIIRDPAFHGSRVYAYLYSDEARTVLEDSCYSDFYSDESLIYIHAAGLWAYDASELDDDQITFRASKLRLYDMQSGSAELPAQFIVGQATTELKAGFWTPGHVTNLLGTFSVNNADSVDVLGAFSVRRSASQELRAYFTGQAVLSLKATMVVYHPDSENLLAGFVIRHLTDPYRIIVEDAFNAWLTYWSKNGTGWLAPPIGTEDHVEKYSGQNSYRLYLGTGKKGSETLTFGWARLAYSNLKETGSGEIPSEFNVIHTETFDLPAAFTVLQGSVDLKGSIKVTTPSSVELAAEFIVQYDDSQSLLGGFTGRQLTSSVLLAGLYVPFPFEDLKAEFIVRRTATRELKTGFTVIWLPGSSELYNKVIVRHGDGKVLSAEFFVQIPTTDLRAELIVRRTATRELKASFKGQATCNLRAEFTVRPAATGDLLAGFAVRHSLLSGDTVIAEGNMVSWVTYWERYGTGFISLPVVEDEGGAFKFSLTYMIDAKEALIFGWNQRAYRESTARKSVELRAGFDIS